MKVAMVQMGVREDKFENMFRAAGFVAQAAAKGADIVVLPEMFNCPYQTRNFPVYAEKAGGECWQILADAARDSHVYLVGGSIPERDDEGRVYNTSFVFDRAGDQIARCRKTHMFDIDVPGGQRFKESETLTPGSEITTFDTEFGTMGLLICYDIRFPEMMRVMANRGAKVVFVPAAFNMTTGPAHWELLFRCRAADYQLFTVGAAPARDEKGVYVSYANSIIVSPWGKVLLRLGAGEEIGLYDVSLGEVDRVRTQLPLRNHYKPALYETQAKL